jgi:SAM-dependent methyltransferase
MVSVRSIIRNRAERWRLGPFGAFLTGDARAINAARQDHLASLGLPIDGTRVLEVGAGIGLHTEFFAARGCTVVSTDGRAENVAEMRRRNPHRDVGFADLDTAGSLEPFGHFDICYCYGVLYHLRHPDEALREMAAAADMILLETCLSFGEEEKLHPLGEDAQLLNQAVSGSGCRPTRAWVMNRLERDCGHAYMSRTRPDYPDFVTDWTIARMPASGLVRAVFVGSREPLNNPLLSETVVDRLVTA